MALSKRHSRAIVVAGESYRWSPSQDSGYMVLVVQHESGTGSKLEVVIPDGKKLSVEGAGYKVTNDESAKLVIAPRLVEKVILDALDLGWQANQNGKPLQLSIRNQRLEPRHGAN